MVYRNTPLGNCWQSPMEVLSSGQARPHLLMSYPAWMPIGQDAIRPQVNTPKVEGVRSTSKNQAQATTNLLPIGIHVMHKTPSNKL